MREGITVEVSAADRARLQAVVADWNSSQKHAWRARIILATAEGCGTAEIMRRSGKSKPCVWRWQERLMREGVPGLLRDKTRRPGIPPLLWAERYDRVLTDVFAVQDEIVGSIVAALKVALLPGEAEAIQKPPTGDLDAYQLYLRGRQLLLGRRDKQSRETARRLFAQAVALDPGFARAHAGVAECDAHLYMHHGASLPAEEVLAAAEAALALEPGLAAAHVARGVALVAAGRLAEAEEAYGRAIALEPDDGDAHHRHARLCFQQGRMEDAARLFRRAAELSPDDIYAALILLGIEQGLGRHEAARATARLVLERAGRELERHPENAYAAYSVASALVVLGDREGAVRLAERALALAPDDHVVQYNVAGVYACLGEVERALDLLERAMPGASAHRWAWLAQDADWDPLRGHPRFEALLRRRGADG
jgi:adenylate cyclase